MDIDPRTFDIFRAGREKDAAYLRCIGRSKGFVRVFLDLFLQCGLYLARCFRPLHLPDDGIGIFRNAFFNIFQTDKNIYKACLTRPPAEPECPSLIFLST